MSIIKVITGRNCTDSTMRYIIGGHNNNGSKFSHI